MLKKKYVPIWQALILVVFLCGKGGYSETFSSFDLRNCQDSIECGYSTFFSTRLELAQQKKLSFCQKYFGTLQLFL